MQGLVYHYFLKIYHILLQIQRKHSFVLEKEGNIYTFLNAHEVLYKSEIDEAVRGFDLHMARVRTNHRGRGLGKRISLELQQYLYRLCNRGKEGGCRGIFIKFINSTNEIMERCLSRIGWTTTQEIVTAFLMKKRWMKAVVRRFGRTKLMLMNSGNKFPISMECYEYFQMRV